MKAYLDIVKNILDNGIEKVPTRRNPNTNAIEPVDGGIKTIGLPNLVFSHNMKDGFPLLTTRKMPFKSMCIELEGFIKGITSKSWYQAKGCHFWDFWANPKTAIEEFNQLESNESVLYDGLSKKESQFKCDDLGEIYGFLWRCFPAERELVKVISKQTSYSCNGLTKNMQQYDTSLFPEEEFYKQIFSTRTGNFEVIKNSNKDNHKKYTIKFLDTGTEKKVSKTQITCKQIRDEYGINILNVARTNGIIPKTAFEKIIFKNWYDMINRCYNPKSTQYKWYGKIGIKVCDRWLEYKNYRRDIESINGWQLKLRNPNSISLDKDYYNSKTYAPDVCVFINQEDNKIYNSMIPLKISNGSQIFICANQKQAGDIIGVTRKAISYSINKNKKCKGWKISKLDGNYRYKLPKDQLLSIVDSLQNSPNDRRMICSAWNPTNFDKIALNSCHFCWGVTVYGDTLNLWWTQRSVDVLLGLANNIPSYALLLELLASTSDLQAGNLTGLLVDCHIYENQIEGAKEQITREPKQLPNIMFRNKSGKLGKKFHIFDWTYEDVELLEYSSYDKIAFGQVVV